MEFTPNIPVSSGAEKAAAPSASELQEFHTEQAASNFAERNRLQQLGTPGAGTDVNAEIQLQAIQQQIVNETNPFKRQALEDQAWALANSLVTGKAPAPVPQRQETQAPPQQTREVPAPTQQVEQEEQQTEGPTESQIAAEELIADRGEEAVNSTLTWASEALSEEVSEAVNEAFTESAEAAYTAYSGLEQLKNLPSEAIRTDAQVGHFDPSVAEELVASFGQDGEALVTINAALATGATTRAQAIRLVASNPSLLRSAMMAASQGLIQLAL